MKKVTKSSKPKKDSGLGERIKYVRTNKNITQQDLADAVQKKREEIAYFENGTRLPDMDTLIRIAKYLEVSLDYLGGLNEIEKPNAEYQAIYELTGLTEQSIYQLSKFKNIKKILEEDGSLEDYELADIEKEEMKLYQLNKLLESIKFEEILSYMVDYEETEKQIKQQPTSQAFQKSNLKMLEDKKALIEYKITKKITEILNEK